MSVLNILIVEDEVIIANDIKDMIEELGHHVVEICISGKEAITILNSKKVDLALLDITLKGGINGIDLATRINEEYKIPFIFLTSHSDSATVSQAVQQDPDGYIVKPFEKADLFTSIQLCMHKKADTQNNDVIAEKEHLFVKDGTTYVKLPYDKIKYLKSSGNYVDVFCSSGRHSIRATIKDMMKDLPDKNFIQVHKSVLINTDFLESFNSTHLSMDGEELPIGRAYKENLKNLL